MWFADVEGFISGCKYSKQHNIVLHGAACWQSWWCRACGRSTVLAPSRRWQHRIQVFGVHQVHRHGFLFFEFNLASQRVRVVIRPLATLGFGGRHELLHQMLLYSNNVVQTAIIGSVSMPKRFVLR
jgi:hypothetical protein